MQQEDQTVISLRPGGGGGGPRGTRFLAPRYDSSSSSSSDAQPLRPHGGFAPSSALKVSAKTTAFFSDLGFLKKKSDLFGSFSFLFRFFFFLFSFLILSISMVFCFFDFLSWTLVKAFDYSVSWLLNLELFVDGLCLCTISYINQQSWNLIFFTLCTSKA